MKTIEDDMQFHFDWDGAAKMSDGVKTEWLLRLLNRDQTCYDADLILCGDTMLLKLMHRESGRIDYYDLCVRRSWVEREPQVDIHHDEGE